MPAGRLRHPLAAALVALCALLSPLAACGPGGDAAGAIARPGRWFHSQEYGRSRPPNGFQPPAQR